MFPHTVAKDRPAVHDGSDARTTGAFGGEMSGHYYWKEMGVWNAPELTLLRVYEIVPKSEKTLGN